MVRRILIASICLLVASPAFATWSVIAVDQRTGTVVIASATCVSGAGLQRMGGPNGLMGIQAIVVPGVGVAAAQAGVDQTRENQMLIYRELQEGIFPPMICEGYTYYTYGIRVRRGEECCELAEAWDQLR